MAQETVSGVVESTNDKGIKVNGEWKNYSVRYFKGTKPSRGDSVTLQVSGNFINECRVTGSGEAAPAQASSAGGYSRPAYNPTKDRDIRRQVALKAAVEVSIPKNGIPDDEELEAIVSSARYFETYLNETFDGDERDDG